MFLKGVYTALNIPFSPPDITEAEIAEDADKTYIEKILPAKMKYNLEGVLEFSFFGDIKIMFMTIAAMFGNDFNKSQK